MPYFWRTTATSPAARGQGDLMEGLLNILVIIAIWLVVTQVILPKLGIKG